MPITAPIVIKREGTPTWLYNALRRLADVQVQTQRGFGAIIRGETPDGSGTPLVDTTKFFFKPGLPGGQVAFGATEPGGRLVLSSTANSTKGTIYFGSALTTVFDELHERIGITSPTPAAKLEIKQPGTTQSFQPNSLITAQTGINWVGDNGDSGSTRFNRVNELVADDIATYVQDGGLPGGNFTVGLPNITPQSTSATITCFFRIRWNGTGGGTAGLDVSFTFLDGNSTGIHTLTQTAWVAPFSGAHDTGWVTFSFTLTAGEISSIANWNNMKLRCSSAGGGSGYSGTQFVTWMQLQIAGATATDLVDLYDVNGNLTGGFTSAAALFFKTGAAAGNWFKSDANGVASWSAPGALTKTDDTNVTLTLGGSPTTALLNATSLTLGWTGQLAIARGGTGQSTKTAAFDALSPLTTLGDLIYHNGTNNVRLAGNTTTAKQFLSQTGTGTASAAPVWAAITSADLPSTISNKTLDNTNVITVKDTNFTLQDDGDTTKQVQFQLSGIATGQTRILTIQNASGTVAYLDVAQVFTAAQNIGTISTRQQLTLYDDDTLKDGGIVIINSNGTGKVQLSGAGHSAFDIILFPDLGGNTGTLVTDNSTNTLTAKTFSSGTGAGNIIEVTGVGLLFAKAHGAVTGMRLDLSALGATTRVWKAIGDFGGNLPIVGNQTGAATAGNLGKRDLTGQTGAITTTALTSTPAAGLYLIEAYAACTTASGSGAPTLDVTIGWTDVNGAPQTQNAVTGLSLSATGFSSGRVLCEVASGNITYATTINSASGTPQYALYIRVVALG